jgi:hypothetical protein
MNVVLTPAELAELNQVVATVESNGYVGYWHVYDKLYSLCLLKGTSPVDPAMLWS